MFLPENRATIAHVEITLRLDAMRPPSGHAFMRASEPEPSGPLAGGQEVRAFIGMLGLLRVLDEFIGMAVAHEPMAPRTPVIPPPRDG